MPALFISPGQFTRRAEFYFQLAQFLSAGVDLNHALRHLRQNASGRSYRETSGQLLEQIGRGCTFCEALKDAQKSLPPFDLALLKAGEESGRLDRAFRLLADYYRKQAELLRQVIGGLAYPAYCHDSRRAWGELARLHGTLNGVRSFLGCGAQSARVIPAFGGAGRTAVRGCKYCRGVAARRSRQRFATTLPNG